MISIRRRVLGFTLLEVLVSFVLLAVVLTVSWRVAATQKRVFERLLERQAILQAERTVSWVLSTEIGAGRPGHDRDVLTADVLDLRAFRGRGWPCAARVSPQGWLPVRQSGWRRPEPAKDSVVLLDGEGRRAAFDLQERAAGATPCRTTPGEYAEWWRLSGAGGLRATFLRYFERGSYHLEDAAFRYRRGRAGRQPLTEEVLDGRHSGLVVEGPSVVVRFHPLLRPDPSGGGAFAATDSGWVRSFREP